MLTTIFGEYPRVKILNAFAENFEEGLSVEDLLWLTDISKDELICHLKNLLDEEYILDNDQLYYLNVEKIEVKIILLTVNFLVSYKLREILREKNLNPYI